MLTTFECKICLPELNESDISSALAKTLPNMKWEEGDSSWDKIRVIGQNADASIRVYRYEDPGPFELTIKVQNFLGAKQTYLDLRDKVLLALNGTLWKKLGPQPVSLVKPGGHFPNAYQFECDLDLHGMKKLLNDAQFWFWEGLRTPGGIAITGRIPFERNGNSDFKRTERIRITGSPPNYTVGVDHWDDEPGLVLTCDQVHEILQNTILPALGARNVSAATPPALPGRETS